MRKIFPASKEPQKRPPLAGDMVAYRSPQHRIARLERVKNRSQRSLTLNVDLHLVINPGQRSQMVRKSNSNHGIT